MPDAVKKLLIVGLLFAFWLGTDLWTKQWADETLADPGHPLLVQVSEAEAGRPLEDVIRDRLQPATPAQLKRALEYTSALPPAPPLSPDEPVYAGDGLAARASGFHVFWRSNPELPSRRVDKTERHHILSWLRAASPDVPDADRGAAVDGHLADVTLADWLSARVRRLSHETAVSLVAEGRVHPIFGPPRTAAPSTAVAAGDRYIVRWNQVDVMGDWWKWTYAENRGAAFGFLKNVQPTLRESIFLGLTCLVFLVIFIIILRIPSQHLLIHLAMASVLGGAMGNFVDRFRYGYVIDFIDMHLGFMHWPTYNIADIAIAVGVGLLVLEIAFNRDSPLVQEGGPRAARPD